jgi:mono/diheme cytochrome c family protein
VSRLWGIPVAAAALVGVAALGFVGWNVFGPGPTDFAGRDRVALSDAKLADPTGVPASLIERGRYLIRAADCEACHTSIGGQPFAGAGRSSCPSARGGRRPGEAGMAMPAFGDAYSDAEIAAAANYVTARLGAVGSRLTADNVASLRLTR